jgi:hypothetical protein
MLVMADVTQAIPPKMHDEYLPPNQCLLSALENAEGADCALQGFQLQAAARQGKLGLCVPDLPAPVPVGDNIGQPL